MSGTAFYIVFTFAAYLLFPAICFCNDLSTNPTILEEHQYVSGEEPYSDIILNENGFLYTVKISNETSGFLIENLAKLALDDKLNFKNVSAHAYLYSNEYTFWDNSNLELLFNNLSLYSFKSTPEFSVAKKPEIHFSTNSPPNPDSSKDFRYPAVVILHERTVPESTSFHDLPNLFNRLDIKDLNFLTNYLKINFNINIFKIQDTISFTSQEFRFSIKIKKKAYLIISIEKFIASKELLFPESILLSIRNNDTEKLIQHDAISADFISHYNNVMNILESSGVMARINASPNIKSNKYSILTKPTIENNPFLRYKFNHPKIFKFVQFILTSLFILLIALFITRKKIEKC